MKKLLLIVLMLSWGIAADAQVSNREVRNVTSNPTSCASTVIYKNTVNATLWGRSSTTGLCVQLGGSGTVSSVSVVTANGLSGSVATATTTPAITLNISGLDASKIGGGNVSTAEFDFLSTVNANVQTQIDGKQSALTNSAGLRSALSDENGTGVDLFDGAVAPALTSPRITTDISDTNGNELFKVTATASAVNELTIANAASGGHPTISATGSDTDINVLVTPKGAGWVQLPATGIVLDGGGGPQAQRSGNFFNFGVTNGTGATLMGGNSTSGVTGLFLKSDGQVSWGSSAASSTVNDTTISRNAAGLVQFGTTTANALGSIYAAKAGLGAPPDASASVVLIGVGTNGNTIKVDLIASPVIKLYRWIGVGTDYNPVHIVATSTGLDFRLGTFAALGSETVTSYFKVGNDGLLTLNSNYTSCTSLTTNASNVLGCTVSTAKHKQGFQAFTNGLQAIRSINPQTFSWKSGTFADDGGKMHLGLIAEDLQAANPLLVSRQGNGDMQPEPMALHAIEIDAIKRLDARITALENENRRLKAILRRGRR